MVVDIARPMGTLLETNRSALKKWEGLFSGAFAVSLKEGHLHLSHRIVLANSKSFMKCP